jgi:hypothetical protein
MTIGSRLILSMGWGRDEHTRKTAGEANIFAPIGEFIGVIRHFISVYYPIKRIIRFNYRSYKQESPR